MKMFAILILLTTACTAGWRERIAADVAAFNARAASDVRAVGGVLAECATGDARETVVARALPAVLKLLTTTPLDPGAWLELARTLARQFGAGVLRCALAHVTEAVPPPGELGARGVLQPDGTRLHRAAAASTMALGEALVRLRRDPGAWARSSARDLPSP